jgi:ABC-type transport system substrate-binding protein
MHRSFAAGMTILLSLSLPAAAAEMPKRGGTLTYMIPADAPPSFDGHRENTFATIHAVAPFYSVLIRANPENPASTTEFVCDVCTEISEPTDRGRTYAFPIREDVRFQDGSVLTAYDVAASWNKIVDPPEGVISARRGYYSMIDKVEAPDPKTVVFRLKLATAAFLPALADPYAFIYKKQLLDRDGFPPARPSARLPQKARRSRGSRCRRACSQTYREYSDVRIRRRSPAHPHYPCGTHAERGSTQHRPSSSPPASQPKLFWFEPA